MTVHSDGLTNNRLMWCSGENKAKLAAEENDELTREIKRLKDKLFTSVSSDEQVPFIFLSIIFIIFVDVVTPYR
jgi:hypothetical protein